MYISQPGVIAPCVPGRFLDAASATCIDCPVGKYQRETGRTYCDTCAEGFVCDTPDEETGLMIEPRVCPVGRECTTSYVENGTCREEGKRSNEYGKCASCANWEFSDLEGNGCVSCPTKNVVRRDGREVERLVDGVKCKNGRIRVKNDYFVIAGGPGRSGRAVSIVNAASDNERAIVTELQRAIGGGWKFL